MLSDSQPRRQWTTVQWRFGRPAPPRRKVTVSPFASPGAGRREVVRPYKAKPYKFVGFGTVHGPKPYKFIGFGSILGPKPYKFIGFGFLQSLAFFYDFFGFVGAMAWPWPSHSPNKSKKITKKAKNCNNPKYGLISRGFGGPERALGGSGRQCSGGSAGRPRRGARSRSRRSRHRGPAAGR
jgi:hypothetical protein